MSLLDRLNREKEAAERAYQAATAARLAAEEAAQRARSEQAAREQAARDHLYRLYAESPAPALMEAIVKHKGSKAGTERFGDGLSAYGVRVYWNKSEENRGSVYRVMYLSVSAEMHRDGTLVVGGRRRKEFSLEQWRHNPQAIDTALENAYLNPERVDKMVNRGPIADFGE